MCFIYMTLTNELLTPLDFTELNLVYLAKKSRFHFYGSSLSSRPFLASGLPLSPPPPGRTLKPPARLALSRPFKRKS